MRFLWDSWAACLCTSYSFYDEISAADKSTTHIQQLCCIRVYLYFKSTIATSIVQSKLDYCNSLYYKSTRFSISSSATHPEWSHSRAVLRLPEASHFIPSLHWFRTEYNFLSLWHSSSPPNLYNYTVSPLLDPEKHSFLRGCHSRSSTFVVKSKQTLFPHHRVDRSTSKRTSQISCSSVVISVIWSLSHTHHVRDHFLRQHFHHSSFFSSGIQGWELISSINLSHYRSIAFSPASDSLNGLYSFLVFRGTSV